MASVLSGNRNFEGRIQPLVRANYLASPPLVVAYALAGRMTLDLTAEPIGQDESGANVYLRDLWPSEREIQEAMLGAVRAEMFVEKYADVFAGDDRWKALPAPEGERFAWEADSTYIRKPPFFEGMTAVPPPVADIEGARVLAVLGDSVTTDHISPAGSIRADSPAGQYLIGHGVKPADFNSYGARRGNHEVMMRGTFANIRLRNQLVPGGRGRVHAAPAGRRAADDLRRVDEVPGGGRAARHPRREGIRVGIVARLGGQGHEAAGRAGGDCRELRADPSQQSGQHGRAAAAVRGGLDRRHARTHGPRGRWRSSVSNGLAPRGEIAVRVTTAAGVVTTFPTLVRIDTPEELVAFRHGGILPYVLRQLAGAARS